MKRLFFGFELIAPWNDLPLSKRLLPPERRHLTLAFLGDVEEENLLSHIVEIPKPPFLVGKCGVLDTLTFLPKRHPRLVSFHADLGSHFNACKEYAAALENWLITLGYSFHQDREWLPHATISREATQFDRWKSHFTPLPFYFDKLQLYQSFPQMDYRPLRTVEMLKPFEELEHTADIAFLVRGETIEEIQKNAFIALAFKAPSLLHYPLHMQFKSQEEIVKGLNQSLASLDSCEGSPLKAVSYHGEISTIAPNQLEWEMIIDV